MSAPQRPSRELPRRLLGAVLTVFMPGAGHVILGYHRLGWIVAAIAILLGAGAIGSALACVIPAFLACGAIYIFGTVLAVISIFALPPGPRLAEGLRALWPVFVLFLVFRGGAYLVQSVLVADVAPDAAMKPAIERGDVVFAATHPGSPEVGQVVIFEHPAGSGKRVLRRIRAVEGDAVSLKADDAAVASDVPDRIGRSQIRARALFVFAAARGTNGQGRVWKRLGP